MSSILKILGFLILVIVLAEAWGYFWLMHGWIGPPKLIRLFVTQSGEFAYDLVSVDMYVAVVLIMFSIKWLMREIIG